MAEDYRCKGCGSPITATTLNCKSCGKLALDIKTKAKPAWANSVRFGCIAVSGALGLLVVVGMVIAFLQPSRQPSASASAPSATSSTIPTDRGGRIAYINRLIAKGDAGSTTTAMMLIHERFTADELRDDAEVRALLDRAISAAKVAGSGTREREYAERVSTYWLPQIAKMSAAPPTEPEALWQEQSAFEDLARSVADGVEFKTGVGATGRRTLYRALAAKQRERFPILRRAYGQMVKAKMWPLDVDVTTTGTAHRTMNFVGGRYAANQNIADGQAAAQTYLVKLRFKVAHYEWFKGAGGYSYTMETPTDGAVGTWNNGNFEETAE